MQLTGLGLGQLALVFGVAAAGTVALYMLRLRRRRIRVPFVALWSQVTQQSQSNRLTSRLKHLWSLWLALAVVALLTLALGDPRATVTGTTRRPHLLLIDTSITMQATDGGSTRLQVALDRARTEIDALPTGERAMLVQVDSVVAALSAFSDDRATLHAALRQVQATDLPLALDPAMRFVSNVLRGEGDSEVVWISDFVSVTPEQIAARLADDGIGFRAIGVGHKARNVGVSAFAARRYPLDKGRSQAFVELHNGSGRDEKVVLTVLADGAPIESETLTLPAAGTTQRVYDALAGTDRRVEAAVRLADGTHDALRADDRAVALLPARRRARVLAVTDGNLYLEAALLLDEYLQVDTQTPEAYVPDASYDVVIFDRFVPSEPPTLPSIYLAPATSDGRSAPFAVRGTVEQPVFAELLTRDPLLRFVALGDVNIASSLRLDTQPNDVVLGRDASGAPLLVRAQRNGTPLFALAFDVRQSDLPLRVAWPLLLIGMIDALSTDDTAYVPTRSVGERVDVPVPPSVREVAVHYPGGERATLTPSAGTVPLLATRAGYATLSAPGYAEEFGFQLQPNTPRGIAPGHTSSAKAHSTGNAPSRRWLGTWPPWIWIVSVVALLLSLEWFSYQRRWTL